METKIKRYIQRKRRVKSRIFGTEARPRLSVFRSNSHIYGQVINDDTHTTLVSVSDLKIKAVKGQKKSEKAFLAGEELAKKAIAKKVKLVVFDRNGFRYHGRVKSFADGARKGGLEF